MRSLASITLSIVIATTAGMSGQTQTRTADGVAALARGDYQLAVEILKPIAEDWRSEDAAAQFFMAGLHDAGRGVPVDPLRACALYARAASHAEQPFGQQAMTLYAAALARGLDFFNECHFVANTGFEHGLEPVTFELAAGHTVQWSVRGATVTYDGQTRSHPLGLAQLGDRFLPLQHTVLATGPSRSAIRHFIEVFRWRPLGKSGPFQLQWDVFEVVGTQIIGIRTPDVLLTVEGDSPPSQPLDIREYAVLRVDDDYAEWAILKGPSLGAQRIESNEERQEVRDTARARDAARSRVDWGRRFDPQRQPVMNYIDADGCGRAQVYGWTADFNEAMVVRAKLEGPSTQLTTFDIARDLSTVSLSVHVFETPQRQFYFCSDVIMPAAPGATGPEVWRAVAGTVDIELSGPGVRAHMPSLQRATVTLSGVVLQNAVGATARMTGTVKLSAVVGLMY